MKTMLLAAMLSVLPSATFAQNYCSDQAGYSVSTHGKGYDLTFSGSSEPDYCTPAAKKHMYTCQGGEGRYTLKIEPAGKGIKVTQGDAADVLLPCK